MAGNQKQIPHNRQKKAQGRTCFESKVKRWLKTPDEDEEECDLDAQDQIFERWLTGQKALGNILEVDGVQVDRALTTERFDCLPERCSPACDRGRSRSCCADVYVYLTPQERTRLARHKKAIDVHMLAHEPRLKRLMVPGKNPAAWWLAPDGQTFRRPQGRCVFSNIDDVGRIRCHLHPLAQSLGLEQNDIQPITCRLFPLVLVDMGRGRVLLTVTNKANYKAFGGRHPRAFPCLGDSSLPPVTVSMRGTLDWLFGKGFAKNIEGAARR